MLILKYLHSSLLSSHSGLKTSSEFQVYRKIDVNLKTSCLRADIFNLRLSYSFMHLFSLVIHNFNLFWILCIQNFGSKVLEVDNFLNSNYLIRHVSFYKVVSFFHPWHSIKEKVHFIHLLFHLHQKQFNWN